MSTPTFDGDALTARGEQQTLGPPMTRTFKGILPGVEGMYGQGNPVGGHLIIATGLMAAAGNTAALAFSTLLGVIETMQAKQGETKDYIGTGGQTYDDCVLDSYTHGPITTGPTSGAITFTAVCRVEARLTHLVPSNIS